LVTNSGEYITLLAAERHVLSITGIRTANHASAQTPCGMWQRDEQGMAAVIGGKGTLESLVLDRKYICTVSWKRPSKKHPCGIRPAISRSGDIA